MKMDKQQVVYLMLESMVETNKKLSHGHGMSEEELEKQMDRSLPSMIIIVSDIYDKMKEANLLA